MHNRGSKHKKLKKNSKFEMILSDAVNQNINKNV